MYDKLQSEDPLLTFPFDFYATNFGAALQSYVNAGTGVNYWDCPTNPSLYSDFSNPLPADTTPIFSVGDNNRMYPPPIYNPAPVVASDLDRSSFYVAKAPAGVFSIPFNAFLGPTIVSAFNSTSNPAPLGYGAAPIPTGVGKEQCPLSAIPAGYHWVKVWLFRSDLPPRHYLSSPKFAQIGQISCNRQWVGLTGNAVDAGKNVFVDCGIGASARPLPGSANGTLADRIITNGPVINNTQTGGCININAPASSPAPKGAGATSSGVSTQRAGFTAYGFGTDFLQYVNPQACTNPAPFPDGLGLCTNNNNVTSGVPADFATTITAVPNDGSRFDFIFTVSPDISWATASSLAVNSGEMEAGTGNSRSFTPYRFKTSADCAATSASGAPCVAAASSNLFPPYGIKLHDVGTNGDPSATDPNRPGVFPMCAIQRN